MVSEIRNRKPSASEPHVDLKRRGLLRFGTLLTAFSGVTALGATSAHAAPGDKNTPNTYVPLIEKGAASGVATLDNASKIPLGQIPDLSMTFVRKGATRLNVKDFGAVGNDVADDHGAILEAYKAARAAAANGTSSEVYFPAGTYKVSSDLNIDASDIEFVGDGNTTQIHLNGVSLKINGTASLIMFNGLRNMRIVRNGTPGVAVAIVGGGAGTGKCPVRWHLDNVHIASVGGTGLRLAGTFLGTVYNLYIRNAVTGLVIDYDDSLGTLAANAINFHGGEIQAVENIGTISGGIAISFFGTTMEGASVSGLDLRAACQGVTIAGCYFEANRAFDVRAGDNGQVYGLSLSGSYFSPGAYGPKERAIILRAVHAADIRANYFYGYSASPLLINETGPGLVTGGDANNHNSRGAVCVLEVRSGSKWSRAIMNGPAGVNRQSAIQTGGVNRWLINWANAAAEAGSNSGSNIEYLAYDDAGVYLGPVMTMYRATQQTRIHGEARIDGAINHDGATAGFFGANPVGKPAGVAVTPEAIHAALVKLGLISG